LFGGDIQCLNTTHPFHLYIRLLASQTCNLALTSSFLSLISLITNKTLIVFCSFHFLNYFSSLSFNSIIFNFIYHLSPSHQSYKYTHVIYATMWQTHMIKLFCFNLFSQVWRTHDKGNTTPLDARCSMTVKAATLGMGGIGKQVVNLSLYFVHHFLLLSLLNSLYVFLFYLLHTFHSLSFPW
jgi:hypothetical protein